MSFLPIRRALIINASVINSLITKRSQMIYLNTYNCTIQKRYAVSDHISANIKNKWYDLVERLNIVNPLSKTRIQANSWLLYETLIDQIPFNIIMKKLDLPDTFNTWFIITELHLWMVFVRIMNEKTKGPMIRNYMMEALWNDVEFRTKKLRVNPDTRQNQVKELSEQIRGALIGYDEGWLTNDINLAGMVWRRIFNQQCNDPQKLEIVVKYIRKQMANLQMQSFDSLYTNKEIKWINFV
ncbi:ubiquinol-cytochrome-c reductase complex assembly factor 1 isoform X2 [Daktulosphaira vitifoliae]|uniref:ubiquinol-cytochrome-c reductase complex assembly factor 1 isoform X2 n=1 Tax=Daktulosphaira vitifoliae TaxID=58002 RepID=UPI0021AA2AFA|nr:ubiquinol-cytochrome-c reductase complex assembly factor 1 isoform X2 [Daktulosphaira vitifoliae]